MLFKTPGSLAMAQPSRLLVIPTPHVTLRRSERSGRLGGARKAVLEYPLYNGFRHSLPSSTLRRGSIEAVEMATADINLPQGPSSTLRRGSIEAAIPDDLRNSPPTTPSSTLRRGSIEANIK